MAVSEHPWDVRFRTRMVELRKAKGMTQTDLARELQDFPGVKLGHQPTVARIESGERPVRLGEAPVIARALGTTVHAMVADEGSDEDLQLSLGIFHDEIDGLVYELADAEAAFRDAEIAAKTLARQVGNQEADLSEAVASGLPIAVDIDAALTRFETVRLAWTSLHEALEALQSVREPRIEGLDRGVPPSAEATEVLGDDWVVSDPKGVTRSTKNRAGRAPTRKRGGVDRG